MKIKLPRKRKKALVKKIGRKDYQLCVIANEVISEEGKKNAHKFPNKMKYGRVISYW